MADNRSPRERVPVDWLVLGLDAGVGLFVGVLTIAVHFGGPDLQLLLTYDSTRPSLFALVGHWVVHQSGKHLGGNLLGYGIVVSIGYVIAWRIRERRWFRLSVLAILIVVPSGSALVSAVAFERLIEGFAYQSRGASAVVAALGGLLFVTFLGAVRRRFDPRATITVGGVVAVIALLSLLSAVSSPSASTLALLGGAVLLIGGIDLGKRVCSQYRVDGMAGLGVQMRANLASLGELTILAVGVTTVLSWLLIGLFPADPFSGPTITNVISHASGLVIGLIIPFWGHRYWTRQSWLAQ